MMMITKNDAPHEKLTNFFCQFSDLSTLIHHLEHSNYSTLIYVLSSSPSIDERISDETYQISYTSQHKRNDMTGYCDVIASEFSAIYKRNVIFWPCPAMKVSLSFDSEAEAANIRCS